MYGITTSIVVLILFATTGCGTNPYGPHMASDQPRAIGRPIDEKRVAEIQKGIHSKQDIQTWFGTPFSTSVTSTDPDGCIEQWLYMYGVTSPVSQNQSMSITTTNLTVAFDKAGKVCRHSVGRSGM